jgi:hypothetical protein
VTQFVLSCSINWDMGTARKREMAELPPHKGQTHFSINFMHSDSCRRINETCGKCTIDACSRLSLWLLQIEAKTMQKELRYICVAGGFNLIVGNNLAQSECISVCLCFMSGLIRIKIQFCM